jgi:hypothetical protein
MDRPGRSGSERLETMASLTEPYKFHEMKAIPFHMIGLVISMEDVVLVDTKLDIIYWWDCPGPVHDTLEPLLREPVEPNPWDKFIKDLKQIWNTVSEPLSPGPC